MPKDTPARVVELVLHGDRLYLEALTHLAKSSPGDYPETWWEENRKAQGLFHRAKEEGYLLAEDLYPSSGPIPPALLERVREASMHEYLCRKRGASKQR